MKKITLISVLFCVVFIFGSCNQNAADNEIIDYPFETIYGTWLRIGSGAMGQVRIKLYAENGKEYMDLTSPPTITDTYKCECKNRQKIKKSLYRFDTEGPMGSMTITIAIESKNRIYVKTTANGMGGLSMERVG